ncbi:MAG: hypothetical protein IJ982_12805 [Fibrobacter sp.]|nr:hypothetical protein [Fibrobacter sp.]
MISASVVVLYVAQKTSASAAISAEREYGEDDNSNGDEPRPVVGKKI